MPLRPNSDVRRPTRADVVHPLLAEGTLRLPDHRRTAVLPGLFLAQLSAHLLAPLGDHTPRALYQFGYEWALRDLVRLSRQLAAEFGDGATLDLWQMDATFVLDRWWTSLRTAGWGTMTLDLSSLSRGFAFVELQHSLVAAHSPGAHQPTCHLYAGLFAGALSFFERSERHAIEFQCAALGAPTCRFVVGASPQIDDVASWRQHQVPPAEIRRRLA